MNIGIDIDGVLTDLQRFELDYGTKFCVEEKVNVNINPYQYWETEQFKWNDEQADKFWNKYFFGYLNNSNSRAFASEVLQKLKQEGNNLIIITARDDYGVPKGYEIQELTKEWLKKQNIKYDKIIFSTDEEKIKYCIENNVDIMIEDSPKNILDISRKVPVIKFDSQYNKETNGENIIIAYSWYHIYDIIHNFQKNN